MHNQQFLFAPQSHPIVSIQRPRLRGRTDGLDRDVAPRRTSYRSLGRCLFMALLGGVAWGGACLVADPVPADLPLVHDGQPLAEIVMASDSLPQVKLAARELRDHLRKISGIELAIVTKPGGVLTPIYVGESEFTRQQGLTLDGLAKEGYRVVATDRYLALYGRDSTFPLYPRGYKNASERERLLKEWQEFTGESWNFPFLDLHDPRYFNDELGFSFFDPSGTLYAVYDFLEQLGVRWYLPDETLGTVIPQQPDLAAIAQDTTRKPVFDWRFLRVGWGAHTPTLLWYKRQKLGVSEMVWMSHGTPNVTRFTRDEHPEYFAQVGAGRVLPRLAPPLRDAMVRYCDKFFERYPELRHASVGPADAFTSIDERDLAAGWLREEQGSNGRLSDYVWTFINQVAAGIDTLHPDKIVMGLAYSFYRQPPTDLERFHPNVGVTYCQHRSDLRDPEVRQHIFAERDRWLEMIPSKEFFVWEYFLWHQSKSQLQGVPVIFTRIQQADMQALKGKSRGEYVEAWPLQSGGSWGLDHLTMCLQARLYWEPDLDLERYLDEYYRLFFGPAAVSMREFYEFAEEVWMRPDSRTISLAGGFLRPVDVARFFAILDRAYTAAGADTLYAQRIAVIRAECAPMRELHAQLTRNGPDFSAPRVKTEPVFDGRLDESFWRDASGAFQDPHYPMRDLKNGGAVAAGTTVLLRWADDDSGLYVGVTCDEPNMAAMKPAPSIEDSTSLYDGDFVELFLERPDRAPFKIVVTPLGATLTQATDPAVVPGGTAWNPKLRLAVDQHAESWDVELFVPREGLDGAEPPDSQQPWGINVCRSRFTSGTPENSAIAPTGGRFFMPAYFGNLRIE